PRPDRDPYGGRLVTSRPTPEYGAPYLPITSTPKGHTMTTDRCAAAHHEDPTPCDGPPVVTVLDAHNNGADGCEHHGARLLASLKGARVYPLPDAPDGAATRVFKAADTTRPFPWLANAPRTEPSQRSAAENRAEPVVFEVEQSGADSDGWDPDDPFGDVERYERGER
ncbi:hypothetical protein O3W51_48210, partial [Streptomyces sp. H39-C1]|nr:hypothetical protein [Streptomyces sp. H39-C1]